MIQTITHIMIISSLIVFEVALIIYLFRLIRGPATTDRIVAFDTTSAAVMSTVDVLSVLMGTASFLDSIMLIAIISFINSVSISCFIGEGHVFNENNKGNL